MAFIGRKLSPSCFVANKGEVSSKVAITLTKAKRNFVIRLTGGCGNMSAEDAEGMIDLLVASFRGYEGSMIFGGTRMYDRNSRPLRIIPGITEVAPKVRQENELVFILGITPRPTSMTFHQEFGLVVGDDPKESYVTVVHPDQDSCMILQKSVDRPAKWIDEADEARLIISDLRESREAKSLLICYNGGETTEKEILFTAELGWPVLLIDGSGRISEQYANDLRFLIRYPNVRVAKKDVLSIRKELLFVGALDEKDLSAGSLRIVL